MMAGMARATMRPRVRKLALTLHIVASVGWLGAVAAFLALAIAGLTSGDAETVRAAYLMMELTTWAVILPLGVAALATGLLQSLGTEWGLARHYWVLAKLLITALSTLFLLLHTQPIAHLADAAALAGHSGTDLRPLRVQLVVDAAAALVALLVATALSVYKPRGVTPYGRRMERERRAASKP